MIKTYECVEKQCAVLHFKYFGVDLKVEFSNGNVARSIGATYTTSDRFTQDAIESDSRFNCGIRLKAVYAEPSDEENAKKQKTTKPAKSGKPGKQAQEEKEDGEVVENIRSCKNMNDVLKFFQDKGEKPESDEDIKQLMDKYHVCFPDVNI